MGAPDMIVNGTAAGGPPIGGTGTTNTIPRWTGPSTLGDSGLIDNGTAIYTTARNVGIGAATAPAKLSVIGNLIAHTTAGAYTNYGWQASFYDAAQSKGVAICYNTSPNGNLIQGLGAAGSNSDLNLNVYGGNVGIGTASPSYKLDVVGAPNAVGAAISTTYGTATTVYSAFRFNNTGLAYGNSEIRNYVDGSTSLGSNLALFTSQVGTGTLTERVRVDQSGNVGIGTASPVGRTDIAGTSVDQLAWGLLSVRSSDAQGADKGGSLAFGGLYDATNSTHWAQISGRKENGTSGQYGGYLAFATRTNGAGANTERVRIDSSGNVGIGTASPAFRLDVVGAASSTAARLQVSNSNTAPALNAEPGLNFKNTTNTNGVYTSITNRDSADNPNTQINFINVNQAGSGAINFVTRDSATGFAERARIDSAGNLILNTANTNATIQAAGTGQGLKLQGTSGTNNTDPNVLDFYADGGTPNSGGVAWTPTLKFGGNTTGITYNTQMGRYTRIGNMVFASCYIRLTSKGTATGAATIDGLPTCVNLAGFYAAGAIGYTAAITSTGTMQINMLANQTQLTIRQVTAVGVNTAVTDTDFANGSEIIVSISYPVN